MYKNSFNKQLKYSEDSSHEDFWQAVYRRAFPDMEISWIPNEPDLKLSGVDRVIRMVNGSQIFIDEKKRKDEWSDILLEFISNDKTSAPGWMEKPLNIHYLAYAFMPRKRCYLLPWQPLRRAWLTYRDSWLNAYRHIKAINEGYTTHSVAIPIDVMLKSVNAALVITVEDRAEMHISTPPSSLISQPKLL